MLILIYLYLSLNLMKDVQFVRFSNTSGILLSFQITGSGIWFLCVKMEMPRPIRSDMEFVWCIIIQLALDC